MWPRSQVRDMHRADNHPRGGGAKAGALVVVTVVMVEVMQVEQGVDAHSRGPALPSCQVAAVQHHACMPKQPAEGSSNRDSSDCGVGGERRTSSR